MKRAHLRMAFAIAALPALVLAQSTPAAPASTTPDPGLYKIPPTTPVGMPPYSISPPTGSSAAGTPTSSRPMTSSDCANGGWQTYSAVGFKTEAACQAWVKKHPAGASTARTPSAKASGTRPRATSPRARVSAVANPPPAEMTPRSVITPLLNPTPNPR